jgi:ABC-type branched-subunit amino acid transport system ATPase component
MVAIARGFMACPTLLMIDEPFLRRAPQVGAQISRVITRLNRDWDGPSAALLQSVEVKCIFLGAGTRSLEPPRYPHAMMSGSD